MKTYQRITSYTSRGGVVTDIVKANRRQKRRYWVAHCTECQRVFFASRVDALTCSAACRQKRYRRALKIRARAMKCLEKLGQQLELGL